MSNIDCILESFYNTSNNVIWDRNISDCENKELIGLLSSSQMDHLRFWLWIWFESRCCFDQLSHQKLKSYLVGQNMILLYNQVKFLGIFLIENRRNWLACSKPQIRVKCHHDKHLVPIYSRYKLPTNPYWSNCSCL